MSATTLDYATLDKLRHSHPAWRLLKADQVALVASFLNRAFIVPNLREMPQSELAEALEDELYSLRESLGPQHFPKSAIEYLNDWTSNDKGWLRKFYRPGSDEPHFDLTPATEKAIAWLASLFERNFIGTESRLLTLFELLKQIADGSETNPEVRIVELKRRRAEIDAEISRLESGDVRLLDQTAVKDRFQQFVGVARELLADFREVEQNFRLLDRSVRERIALWEGSKGELLGEILGERDAIADSDQGRSFRAFWDFLMSSRRQEELTALLERVMSLPAVSASNPDSRLRRIHYDWLEAGEHAQRTVAQLSQQLRRFLDDTAWLENRRIIEILRAIEAKSLAIRSEPPQGEFMLIDEAVADIELPMERTLYKPSSKPRIKEFAVEGDGSEVDPIALFSHQTIDKEALKRHVRQSLQDRNQITLSDLIELRPLEEGLAELLAYFQLAADTFESVVDEEITETVRWNLADGTVKQGLFPRIIFVG